MQVRDLFGEIQPSLVSYLKFGDAQLVCTFTGASAGTVDRWCKGTSPANGTFAIKLWLFLEAVGFEFPELDIPFYNFYLSNLFAYDIITMDEVMQYTGVKNSQTALQILRGQPPMHPAVSFDELRELHDVDLQRAISQFKQSLSATGGTHEVAAEGTGGETPPSAPLLGHDPSIPMLASLLGSVLPLTEYALDEWSPEQRSRLREMLGEEALFRLSNNLNALCSERARSTQGRR